MKKPKLKTRMYEVHVPIPYCEVYLVRARNKREARAIVDAGNPKLAVCVGEVASRRKRVLRVSDV